MFYCFNKEGLTVLVELLVYQHFLLSIIIKIIKIFFEREIINICQGKHSVSFGF
jgi:hypothetical protein